MKKHEGMIDMAELARRLGVSRSTIKARYDIGEIPRADEWDGWHLFWRDGLHSPIMKWARCATFRSSAKSRLEAEGWVVEKR